MPATLRQKAQFYHQLAVSYGAGVPLETALAGEALPVMGEGVAAAGVAGGRPLSEVLPAVDLVSGWEARLLRIGEESGSLDRVLENLDAWFTMKSLQFRELKAKLIFPLMLVLAAITIPPLPEIAAGTLSPTLYLLRTGALAALVWGLYHLLIRKPFELSSSSPFNPLLLRCQRWVGDHHYLRLAHEIAYLDLLSLSLQSGLDAAQALKLLRDSSTDRGHRRRHAMAVSLVEKGGSSLSQALIGNGILRNAQIRAFLASSERSGTLHSDLREYVLRKKQEVGQRGKYLAGRIARWVYFLAIMYAVASIFG